MDYVVWTDDRNERLAKLWDAGHSASEIAAKLGGVTRNAVIGRVRRMKLPFRKGSVQVRPRRVSHAPHLVQARVAKLKKISPLKQLLKALPAQPLPDHSNLIATVSYTDFEPRKHCSNIVAEHMPFKADRKIFCGRKPLEGTSYCEDCCKRNYTVAAIARPYVHDSSSAVKLVIKAEAAKHAAVQEYMTTT